MQPNHETDSKMPVSDGHTRGTSAQEKPSVQRPFTESDLQAELQEMIVEFILRGRQRGRPKNEDELDEAK